jgi:hypothetical protein
LSIGRELRAAIGRRGYDGRVIIGGRLNEDLGGLVPVSVEADLRALGFDVAAEIEDAVLLLEACAGEGR